MILRQVAAAVIAAGIIAAASKPEVTAETYLGLLHAVSTSAGHLAGPASVSAAVLLAGAVACSAASRRRTTDGWSTWEFELGMPSVPSMLFFTGIVCAAAAWTVHLAAHNDATAALPAGIGLVLMVRGVNRVRGAVERFNAP